MKSTLVALAAAASLLQLAAAQPHRAARRHAHQEIHEKRDIKTITNIVYAEADYIPDVIVYVDQFGHPISTTTEKYFPPATSSAPSSSSTPASSTSSATATSTAVTSSVYVVASSSSTASSSPAASSSAASAPSSGGASGFGIAYTGYNSDGSCKSAEQVAQDFEVFGGKYSLVRSYGTDCNQVQTILAAAKSYGMKFVVGIYDLGSLEDEVNTIISAASGDWDVIDTVSVGNELVNSGAADAATVVAAISNARGLLKAAGYNGNVVTIDTLVAVRANPSLCDASDYCAVNCHPFFDGNWAAEDSGSFLQDQIPTLTGVLANPNQRVVISETGWPWKGETNNKAVPSVPNQAAAISSIKAAFSSNPGNVWLFTAFNDYWKTNDASQFEAEQYWGFLGDSPSG